MSRRLLAVVLAVVAVTALAASASAQEAPSISIREAALDPNGGVRLLVAVGGSAAGRVLDASAFSVSEEGKAVTGLKVEPLIESKSQPVVVALAIDVSGSTAGQPLTDAKQAATSFVGALPEGVRIGVVAFERTATLVADFTTERPALLPTIDGLAARGETALYDAVRLAATEIGRQPGLHNIVVFSDGGDTVSQGTLADAVAAAKEAKAPVTSVGLITPDFDQAALNTLAAETEGRSISVAQSGELSGAFGQVAEEIASQYVLTYNGKRTGPKELDLTVEVRIDGRLASDTIAALNPRVAPGPAGPAEPAPYEPPTGVLTSKTGFWLGIAAAFGAAILLFVTVAWIPSGRALKVLQRGLRLYTRGGRKESDTGISSTSIGRRAVELMEQVPKPKGFEEKLQFRLDRAGWPVRANEFLVLQAAGAIAGAGVGIGLLSSPWIALALAVVGALVPRFVLRVRLERRGAAFMAQLPDTLQLLSASLQAGYGLLQAVDTVVKEASPPSSTEFGRVLTEARLGLSLDEALEGMAERVGSEDFRWVVLAINIQRQVGGNLAALLETVAATLREREQLRRQVKVLSAEGRLSAVILSLLPVLLTAYLSVVNPEYLGELTGSGIGRALILGSLAFMGVGVLWMRKIIRIEI